MAATQILAPPQRYYELVNNNQSFVFKVGANLYAVLADDVGNASTLVAFIFKSVDNGVTWTDVTFGKAAKGTGAGVAVAVKGTTIYIFSYLNPAIPRPINVFRWDTTIDDWKADGTDGPTVVQNLAKTLCAAARAGTNEVVVITQTNTEVDFSVYDTAGDTWTTSQSPVYLPGPNLGVGSVGIDSTDRVHIQLIRYDGAIFASTGTLVHISVSAAGAVSSATDVFTITFASNNIAPFLISPLVAYIDANHGGETLAFTFVFQHTVGFDLHRDVVLFTALQGAAPVWASQVVPTAEDPTLLVPDNVGGNVTDASIAAVVAVPTGGGDALVSVIWTNSGNPPLGPPYDANTNWITLDTATAAWGAITNEWTQAAANIRSGPLNPVLLTASTFGCLFITIDFDLFFGGGTSKYDSLALWWFGGTPAPPALSISCNNPPDGVVTVPYSHAFPASHGSPPYAFAITAGALPNGLALNAATGVVSGIPTLAGTFPFTIQVTDAVLNSAEVECSILISDLGIFCDSPPVGKIGVPYSHLFPVVGGTAPYTFALAAGALPDGLALDAATGIVSGTPTTAGVFTFTIEVTDSAEDSAEVTCSIRVKRCLIL